MNPWRPALPAPLIGEKKFARKYRMAIRTGAAFVLLLGIATTISSWLAVRAMLAERLADQRAKEASDSAEKAEKAEMATIEAYRASTDDAIEQLIGSKDVLGPQEKDYLEKTIKRWQEFAARMGEDERSRAIRAEGELRVGELWTRFGEHAKASEHFLAARVLGLKLVSEFATAQPQRTRLAKAHLGLSGFLAYRGQPTEALKESQAAAVLLKSAVGEPAIQSESLETLTLSQLRSAESLNTLGEHAQALVELKSARDTATKLANDYPSAIAYKVLLARCRNSLGSLLHDVGEFPQAMQEFNAVIQLLESLENASLDGRSLLEDGHDNMAMSLAANGKYDESIAALRGSLRVRKELAAAYPSIPMFKSRLADSHRMIGKLYRFASKYDDAFTELSTALRLDEELVAAYPTVPAYKSKLVSSHQALARMFIDMVNTDDALSESRIAVKIAAELANELPGIPDHRATLAAAQMSFGFALADAGRFAECLVEMEAAEEVWRKLTQDFPEFPSHWQGLATSMMDKSQTLYRLNRPQDAQKSFTAARDISVTLAKEHPTMPGYRIVQLAREAQLAARSGAWAEAVKCYSEASKTPPDHNVLWYMGAFARAALGDQEAYANHCRVMLTKFANSDPAAAGRTAKACSLLPDVKIDVSEVCRLANFSLEKCKLEDPYRDHCLSTNAMATYRSGDYSKAIDLAQQSLDQPGTDHSVIEGPSYFIIAMSQWRLGHAEQANEALRQGRERVIAVSQGAFGTNELRAVSWHDEMMGRLLLKECETLLGVESEAAVVGN